MSDNYLYDAAGHISTLAMSLALDGFLEHEERLQIDHHMLACATCATRWSAWQHLDDVLRTEPLIGPAPGFVTRVDRELADRQRRRERWLGSLVLIGGTLSIWSLLVAGLALLSATGLWLSPGARLQILELLGYGGQFIGVAVNSLSTLRAGAVNTLLTPVLVAFLGALLTALAFLWVRLIPPSQTQHSSGVSNAFGVGYPAIEPD